jgi:arsenite methyltransferase
MPQKPDYGIDAPGVVRNLLVIGVALILSGIFFPEKTLANIEAKGVKQKAEIRSEDARKLSFPDASFDVVLSNLCIHNIPGAEERAQACREIARVLKPGGVALISDFILTGFYQDVFANAGLKTSRTGLDFLTFPQLRTVRVEKHSTKTAAPSSP